MASRVSVAQLRAAVKAPGVVIEEVQRRSGPSVAPMPLETPIAARDDFAPATSVRAPAPLDPANLRLSEVDVRRAQSLPSLAPAQGPSAPARGGAAQPGGRCRSAP